LIFGTDGTCLGIGWFEVYAVIEITTITPEQETQSYNVLVQLDGPALGNVYTIWMSRDGYDNLSGEIMSISSSRIRALFVIDGLDHGIWSVNVQDPVTSGEIDFELLAPTPVPEDIAEAVWNYILGDNPDNSSGTALKNLLKRNRQQNMKIEHEITRGVFNSKRR